MTVDYYFSNSAKSYTIIAKGGDGQIETLKLDNEGDAADVQNLLETALNADYAELTTAIDDDDNTSVIIAVFTKGDEETKKLYEFESKWTAGEVDEFFNLVMQMQAADASNHNDTCAPE